MLPDNSSPPLGDHGKEHTSTASHDMPLLATSQTENGPTSQVKDSRE